MPLTIQKASDPVEVKQIVSVIYGLPGHGKTSLAYSAKNPLLLDFDGRSYRAGYRNGGRHVVSQWSEVANVTPSDVEGFDTIIVDTAGRALEHIIADLHVTDPGLFYRSGVLKLNGYGVLKAVFTNWINNIQLLGKDVVLVAHADENNSDDGRTISRIEMAGSSKNEVYKVADVICNLVIDQDGRRQLNFSPTDTALGKDPGQLGTLEVPDLHGMPGFWEGITDRIKHTLSASADDLRIENERLKTLENSLGEVELDKFNEMVSKMRDEQAGPLDKKIVIEVARKRGFSFNKESGTYEVHVIA